MDEKRGVAMSESDRFHLDFVTELKIWWHRWRNWARENGSFNL